MSVPIPARRTAGTALLLACLVSSIVLVGLLARQVARERDKADRAKSDQREVQVQVGTLRTQAKDSKEEVHRLEDERARRAGVVEGETAALRAALATAVRERDALDPKYRAAVAERDRSKDMLLAARLEQEALRNDLARAVERASTAESAARDSARDGDEAKRKLEDATVRVAALLKPFFQDLRSNDGSIRVRAHEALCAYAGRDLPFRLNGKPEEREEDAKAIEAALLSR